MIWINKKTPPAGGVFVNIYISIIDKKSGGCYYKDEHLIIMKV